MLHKYLVEFLGTMFLSFIIFATGNYLAIGAALAIGAFLGGSISGGSFNPAVTLALYNSGKLMKSDISAYRNLPWETEADTNMTSLYPMFINSKHWKDLKGKDGTLDYIIDNI